MNPERAVVGLALEFGERDRNGEPPLYGWQFADFIASGTGVPMLLDHRVPIMDEQSIGTWHAFAALDGRGGTPPGLLALGSFALGPAGQALMGEVERDLLAAYPARAPWGLSVRVGDVSAMEDGSKQWIREVSLTRKPAHPRTRVLDVGEGAMAAWELLTGTRPPTVTSLGPRIVARRLLGATTTGRPIYDDGEA